MRQSQPRTAWIVAPPEICVLCKEPLSRREETSSWNGQPAHRECVRVHLIQRDPAFRELGSEEPGEDGPEASEEMGPRSDDDEDIG
jgi:hypothetical protein